MPDSSATPSLSSSASSLRRSARDAETEPPERSRNRTARKTAPANGRRTRQDNGLPEEFPQRLRRLVNLARGRRRALVLTHDNPDPDSIASALGLAYILEQKAGVPTRIAYGGIVGRAENRALVKELRLPLVPVSRIVFDDYDFIALVDTQPECGNHSLLARYPADVVIDHHPARASTYDAPHPDVGGDYGATATMVASYVRAAGIEPDRVLATALFYGIKSDTRDLGREFEPADVDNYLWLFPRVDHQALSRIEHPNLPAHYFAAFHRAIGQARRHDEAIVADIDEVYAPDIVAEVAERLLSLENTRWSLALGEYEGQIYFSVRTSDRRMNAGRLVRDLLTGLGGSAGGHGSMAGGRVPLPTKGNARDKAAFKAKIIRSFVREFGAPSKGTPLV